MYSLQDLFYIWTYIKENGHTLIKKVEFILKYKHYTHRLKPGTLIYILFLAGFIFGMIMPFIRLKQESGEEIFWLDNVLLYLKYGEIQYGDLLFYVLKKRVLWMIVFILLGLSEKGKYILLGVVGVAGAFSGYYITEFVIAKGILGILLFITSIFPHYLCYGYSYVYYLIFSNQSSKKTNEINHMSQNKFRLRSIEGKKIIKKITPIAVVIIGIALECYVNPIFLKLFLKIFM